MVAHDLAGSATNDRGEGIDDRLTAADGHRHAARVRGRSEGESDTGGRRVGQRYPAVCAQPDQQRPGFSRAQHVGGAQSRKRCGEAEAGKRKRMAKDIGDQWAEHQVAQPVPVFDHPPDESSPALAVDAEPVDHPPEVTIEHGRRPVIERMGERDRRVRPRQPVLVQTQRLECG